MGTLNLIELAAAIDDPIATIDYWLALGETPDSNVIRSEVRSLAGDAPGSSDIARHVVDLRADAPAIKELAQRWNVTSPAISQRRTATVERLDKLRTRTLFACHPLVDLWRERAHRVVHLPSLPSWLAEMLADPAPESPWGSNHDIARLLVVIAVGRPVVISDDADPPVEWLVDRNRLPAANVRPTFRDLAEAYADQLTVDGTCARPVAEFDRTLVDWGVAPRSCELFRRRLMAKPVRRALEHNGVVLLLSRADAKTVAESGRRVMEAFSLSKEEVANLFTTQQQRNRQAVLNDL